MFSLSSFSSLIVNLSIVLSKDFFNTLYSPMVFKIFAIFCEIMGVFIIIKSFKKSFTFMSLFNFCICVSMLPPSITYKFSSSLSISLIFNFLTSSTYFLLYLPSSFKIFRNSPINFVLIEYTKY